MSDNALKCSLHSLLFPKNGNHRKSPPERSSLCATLAALQGDIIPCNKDRWIVCWMAPGTGCFCWWSAGSRTWMNPLIPHSVRMPSTNSHPLCGHRRETSGGCRWPFSFNTSITFSSLRMGQRRLICISKPSSCKRGPLHQHPARKWKAARQVPPCKGNSSVPSFCTCRV